MVDKRAWVAGFLVSVPIVGCGVLSALITSAGVDSESALADPYALPRTIDARGKLEDAKAAALANDHARAAELLKQAEADAWLTDARDRNRLLLDIQARQVEVKYEIALREQARQASLASRRDAQAIPQATAPAEVTAPLAATAPPASPEGVTSPPQTRPVPPGIAVTLGGGLFAVGSAVLHARVAPVLNRLAAFLRVNPSHNVLIEGFTDSTGSRAHNLVLSEQRAHAVREALMRRGVQPERTRVRGYGEAFPVASNDTAAGRQLNRRVEIVVSNPDGKIPQTRAASSAR